MEPIFFNMNVGVLVGTVCSDFKQYPDERHATCIEFDLELKRFVPSEKAFCITCVSFGPQAELILASKKKGDTIIVFGYIGDIDLGHGTNTYGNHKFRITSVHFQYGTMMNFSGKILTQPQFEENRVEFFVGTYRRHETVPIQPCKMKIICTGKLIGLMRALRGKKNVGDSIFVMGQLTVERGSFCILAKRIEALLPDRVKNAAFDAPKAKRGKQNGNAKDRNNGNSNHGKGRKRGGNTCTKHDGKGGRARKEDKGRDGNNSVRNTGQNGSTASAPNERETQADA